MHRAEIYRTTGEYSFYRDSAIQRFEFTFEIFWKSLKYFLDKEGIICRSPRSCIREFFTAGYLSEDEVRVLFQMIEDRNLTVHTYIEELAEEIFSHLTLYEKILQDILKKLEHTIQ